MLQRRDKKSNSNTRRRNNSKSKKKKANIVILVCDMSPVKEELHPQTTHLVSTDGWKDGRTD